MSSYKGFMYWLSSDIKCIPLVICYSIAYVYRRMIPLCEHFVYVVAWLIIESCLNLFCRLVDIYLESRNKTHESPFFSGCREPWYRDGAIFSW